MNIFKLPYIPFQKNIEKILDTKLYNNIENTDTPFINKTLFEYLIKLKKELMYSDKNEINNYEYIYKNIPNHKYSVSKIIPSNNCFFKWIEIFNSIELFIDIPYNYNCFHLTNNNITNIGLIESIYYNQKYNNCNYYTISHDNDKDIFNYLLSYKKLFNNLNTIYTNNNINFFIEYHTEQNVELNAKYIQKKYNGSMHLIVADNDLTMDITNNEIFFLNLFIMQITYAISIQSFGGIFIIKINDVFLKPFIDIFYLLSLLYDYVFLFKPYISNIVCSDKYIICKKYRIHNNDIEYKNSILKNIIQIVNNINLNNYTKNTIIKNILNVEIPLYYLNKLVEYNTIISQDKLDYLFLKKNTKNKNKDKDKKYNNNLISIIQTNIDWCKKNKIPYNNINYFINK